ncbi:TlpA disulfide reductase family protein [Chitinophaga solisilvae]|uniref:TlpA disulfide reductase family protein n=1 Tax=Chitinophaga solisilvae TaxID=1233460 RepID=UPI00136E53B1|nr:TlpA disulfide reductase family protein [Chitinophaga solisilvae]
MFVPFSSSRKYILTGFLLCALHLVAGSITAQYRYVAGGKLTGGAGHTLYLSPDTYIPNTAKRLLDSVVIGNDEQFRFAGNSRYAGLYSIFIRGQQPFLVFFLDTVPVSIAGDAAAVYRSKVSGGEDQQLIYHFAAMDEGIQQQLENSLLQAQRAQRKNDSIALRRYTAVIDSLNRIRARQTTTFMVQHPAAFQTFQSIELFLGNLVPYDTAGKYLAAMPARFAANPVFERLARQVAGHMKMVPGVVIPEIMLPDTSARLVSFKKLRAASKYILIDFWASWCAPCRANSPALQALYRQYKPLQLEIAGISLDENKNSWKEIIQQEQMPGVQLSDLKGMNGRYPQLFGIRSIPAYLLIDASGRLLLKTNKLQDVSEKLRQLY